MKNARIYRKTLLLRCAHEYVLMGVFPYTHKWDEHFCRSVSHSPVSVQKPLDSNNHSAALDPVCSPSRALHVSLAVQIAA